MNGSLRRDIRMIKFFKRLFCRHNYIVTCEHDEYLTGSNVKYKKVCTKCGKTKII